MEKEIKWVAVIFCFVVLGLHSGCGEESFYRLTQTPNDPKLQSGQTISCVTAPLVLAANQVASLAWKNPIGGTLKFTIVSNPVVADPGALVLLAGGLGVSYQAPSTIPTATNLTITASLNGSELSAFCSIKLAADNHVGIIDDGKTQGMVGNVYDLPPNTFSIPSPDIIDAWTPIETILVSNLSFPKRPYTNPMPGVSPKSWYLISFQAQLKVEVAGVYKFEALSDDGSITYLDGAKIIDLGTHATPTLDSAPMTITAGMHAVRVDYSQWDGPNLGIMLSWALADASGSFTSSPMTIIPPGNMFRPK